MLFENVVKKRENEYPSSFVNKSFSHCVFDVTLVLVSPWKWKSRCTSSRLRTKDIWIVKMKYLPLHKNDSREEAQFDVSNPIYMGL